MEAHPLAKMFPDIPPEEFKQIVADIREKGCFEPIWTYEGKVLDGWHRYRACKRAGVEPKTREWKGDDPRGFVVSMNIMRRHLGAEQRAAFTALAAKKTGDLVRLGHSDGASVRDLTRDERGVSTPDIAKAANVDDGTARRAVRLADERPDLAEKVIAGQMSLTAADAVVSGGQRRARNEKQKEHKEKKRHEDTPREVRVFLESLMRCESAVREAVGVVKFGKFSPEAARFTARKIDNLIGLLSRLYGMLEEIK